MTTKPQTETGGWSASWSPLQLITSLINIIIIVVVIIGGGGGVYDDSVNHKQI